MATIANLDVNLRANTKSFDDKVKKSQQGFGDFAKSIVQKSAVAVTAIAGISTAIVTRFAKAGDEIDKMSKRTNLSVEAVQSLTFAMEQSGGGASDVEAAVRGLNRNYVDLQRGLATAKDNFDALGISQQELANLNTEERFRLVVDRLSDITDEGERAGLAMKLFGRSGTQLLPMVDSLEQLEKRFKAMDVAMSEDQVQAAAELTDQINELRHEFGKMFADIASNLVPVFGPMIEMFRSASKELRDFTKNVQYYLGIDKAERVKTESKRLEDKLGVDKAREFMIAEQAKKDRLANFATKFETSVDKFATSTQKFPTFMEKGSREAYDFLLNRNGGNQQEQVVSELKSSNRLAKDANRLAKETNKLLSAKTPKLVRIP